MTTEQPTTQQAAPHAARRRDGHLTVYLIWPLLAGLGLATILAISIGGLTFLSTGDLATAGRTGGITFFVVLGLATLGVFAYAAAQWAGPRTLAEIHQTVEVIEQKPVEQPPRFIRVRGPVLNQPAPMLPSGVNRSVVSRAIDVLTGRLQRRPAVHVLDAEARSLEPDAPAWVSEFYTTLNTVWPTQSLSRRTFEALWPGGRGKRLWRKYVNGTGHQHAQRGLWDTWGIIAKTGQRGTWQWTQPLQVIYSLDADLAKYAAALAGLHSPTGSARPAGLITGSAQTRPDRSGPVQPGGKVIQ